MKKELITAKLKEIIDEKGTEYLSSDSAEEVYRQLCEAGVEKQQAAAVNHTLLMGLPQFCRQQKALDKETVSEKIQKNCYFRKSYADDLADIYYFGKSTTPDQLDQTWVNCLNLFGVEYNA